MTKDEIRKYMEFMYNPENIHQCDGCPRNDGFDDWQGRFPCGQWNCWVALHCETTEEEEE